MRDKRHSLKPTMQDWLIGTVRPQVRAGHATPADSRRHSDKTASTQQIRLEKSTNGLELLAGHEPE
ncbi:MAG: hypothetical protein Q9203_005358 [Teloschistes exilis]